jgi:hypothetical protein
MEYHVHLRIKEIRFRVATADDDLIDKLAFIHLVAMKFSGDEVGASTTGSGTEKIFHFSLRFPDFDACSQAEAHCGSNIDSSGNIRDHYRGALDKADPGRTCAASMKERAKGNAES